MYPWGVWKYINPLMLFTIISYRRQAIISKSLASKMKSQYTAIINFNYNNHPLNRSGANWINNWIVIKCNELHIQQPKLSLATEGVCSQHYWDKITFELAGAADPSIASPLHPKGSLQRASLSEWLQSYVPTTEVFIIIDIWSIKHSTTGYFNS